MFKLNSKRASFQAGCQKVSLSTPTPNFFRVPVLGSSGTRGISLHRVFERNKVYQTVKIQSLFYRLMEPCPANIENSCCEGGNVPLQARCSDCLKAKLAVLENLQKHFKTSECGAIKYRIAKYELAIQTVLLERCLPVQEQERV